MKIKILPPTIVASIFMLHSAFGQGALTPPGPPAPTMKSLDQIEARTAITNTASLVTISQPGSYYLTANLTVSAGDGIDIVTNDVTLDLNGFTLSSTETTPTGTGILLSGNRHDISILNGHIVGGVTGGGGIYSGPGFENGIIGFGYLAQRKNVRIKGVSVTGCQGEGIICGFGNGTIVESCEVDTAGGDGIVAAAVVDSTAVNCGVNAIAAQTATGCYGWSSGDGDGIYAGSADNCQGQSIGAGNGVYASTAAQNCRGQSGSGVGLSAVSAENCGGWSSSGDGVDATTANNCYGWSTANGNGVYAMTANNCYGSSAGDGMGVWAATANNCNGSSGGNGHGIYANTAENCQGQSSGAGCGVYAIIAAQNCYGQSSGGNGLYATTAHNSYGTSGSAYGLYATTAQDCYGYSNSGSGIYALGSATGCYGYSNGSGYGILTITAQNCWGHSSGYHGLDAVTALNCYGYSSSGTGLLALIGESCSGSSLSVVHNVNSY